MSASFRDHRKVTPTPCVETLSVNTRVSHVYGDYEDKFATWFRDSALYIESWGQTVRSSSPSKP